MEQRLKELTLDILRGIVDPCWVGAAILIGYSQGSISWEVKQMLISRTNFFNFTRGQLSQAATFALVDRHGIREKGTKEAHLRALQELFIRLKQEFDDEAAKVFKEEVIDILGDDWKLVELE